MMMKIIFWSNWWNEFGRGNRSTRRKPAPAPLCPPQNPTWQPDLEPRTAAVGSQRLTAWAMTRPDHYYLLALQPCVGLIYRLQEIQSSMSRSKLYNDRQSVAQSVSASSRIWAQKPDFCYCQRVAGLFMWGDISDERTDLSFTIAAGPRQRSQI
jgi:hypothetical protein